MPSRITSLLCGLALLVAGLVPGALAQEFTTADWTLPTADGGTVSLHDKLAEGPVVVSFWALWCNPCLKEMPQLNRLAGEFEDVTFIAVNIDNSKSVAKVQPFVRAKGYDDLVVALDTGGDVQQIMQIGGMVPYLVVFDQTGSEAYQHVGYKDGDEEELARALEDLLASRPVSRKAAARATVAGPREITTADWTLPTADGGTVTLHDELVEGPVVVSFWALWCNPCLKEMPHLNRLAGEFEDVTFIAVNIDNSKSVAKVQPFVQAKGYDDLTVALDTGGDVQQIMQIGGMIPYLVVFDQTGSEVYQHVGYKEGDEEELERALTELLSEPLATRPAAGYAPGGVRWKDVLSVKDQFKYKYDIDDESEQMENWLDVVYLFGDFRTGIMLNHQAPSEEGNRRNTIQHRFFEFNPGDFQVRVGHYYGLFGRGLVWNGYEDRFIRVDTALDGLYARGRFGRGEVQVLSGTTGTTLVDDDAAAASVDVRGADAQYDFFGAIKVGGAVMTYVPELLPEHQDVKREWVGTGRASAHVGFGDAYVEYGKKTGYDADPTTIYDDEGTALYSNVNLYGGPFSLSVEHSDYERFTVVRRADGKQPLNRPPALVREHIYTLLNRAPHNLDPDDEVGWQAEGNWAGPAGWSVLANASRIEDQNGELQFEEIYGHVEQERIGDFRFRTGFGYRESEGSLRQTVVGEVTWYRTDTHSLTLQAEHQHVRLGVLGAYDQQWFKLEYEVAPRWAFVGIAETNNKYDAQRDPGEVEGDFFPAGQVSYTLTGGGSLNVWAGKRQAGYLCSGGVCKFEPAFEGVELFGVFRY